VSFYRQCNTCNCNIWPWADVTRGYQFTLNPATNTNTPPPFTNPPIIPLPPLQILTRSSCPLEATQQQQQTSPAPQPASAPQP
jgi:hypothetical protein